MSDIKPFNRNQSNSHFAQTFLSKYPNIKLKTITKLNSLGFSSYEQLIQIDLRNKSLVQFVGQIKYNQRIELYRALNELKYGRYCGKGDDEEEVKCVGFVITPKYSFDHLPQLTTKDNGVRECAPEYSINHLPPLSIKPNTSECLPPLIERMIEVTTDVNNKEERVKPKSLDISKDTKKILHEFETRLQQKINDRKVITLD